MRRNDVLGLIRGSGLRVESTKGFSKLNFYLSFLERVNLGWLEVEEEMERPAESGK